MNFPHYKHIWELKYDFICNWGFRQPSFKGDQWTYHCSQIYRYVPSHGVSHNTATGVALFCMVAGWIAARSYYKHQD